MLERRAGLDVDLVGAEVTGLGFEAEASSMLAGGTGASAQRRVDALALAAGAPASEIFHAEGSSKMGAAGGRRARHDRRAGTGYAPRT